MNVAAVGAHPDDVELCAGGTVLRWVADRSYDVTVIVVSDGGRGGTSVEATGSLSQTSKGSACGSRVHGCGDRWSRHA